MNSLRLSCLIFAFTVWMVAPCTALAQTGSSSQERPAPQEDQDEQSIPTGGQLRGPRHPWPSLPPFKRGSTAADSREGQPASELIIQGGLVVARNQELEDVIEALAEKTGVNVLFDSTFRSRKVNLRLRELSPNLALDAILDANNLFAAPANPKSMIVALDNTANRVRLEKMVVRTFFLQHGDEHSLQSLQTHISALFGQRVLVIPNARLRALTVRATDPMMVPVKELIENLDRPVASEKR